jgi:hypothetical protein
MVKVPVGYKLPRWLVGWLREQDVPAAQLIEDALRRRHKLMPPTGAAPPNAALTGDEAVRVEGTVMHGGEE